MPRGKMNSTAKTTSKPEKAVAATAELFKEKAAESEKKNVKPTAEKKKATAPKKEATTKSSAKTGTTKKASTSANAKTAAVTETKTQKAAPNTAKKSTAAKTKTSAASTAKKTAKGKSDEVVFQSGDRDYTLSEITEVCKNAYRGGTRKQIKSIKVYVKAENNQLKAYYVVNDDISGSVDL